VVCAIHTADALAMFYRLGTAMAPPGAVTGGIRHDALLSCFYFCRRFVSQPHSCRRGELLAGSQRKRPFDE